MWNLKPRLGTATTLAKEDSKAKPKQAVKATRGQKRKQAKGRTAVDDAPNVIATPVKTDFVMLTYIKGEAQEET